MREESLSLDHLEHRILDYLKYKYKRDFVIDSITPVKCKDELGEFQAIISGGSDHFKAHIRRDGERIRDNLPLKDFRAEINTSLEDLFSETIEEPFYFKSEIILPYNMPREQISSSLSLSDFIDREKPGIGVTLSINKEDKEILGELTEKLKRLYPRVTLNLYYDTPLTEIDGLTPGEFIVIDRKSFGSER